MKFVEDYSHVRRTSAKRELMISHLLARDVHLGGIGFEFHTLKLRILAENFMEEEYRKAMIKQKKEFEEYKLKEGDSDLIFNKKDKDKK